MRNAIDAIYDLFHTVTEGTIMSENNPTAWADGFGRWHASVPISNPNRQAHLARKAIKDALDERGDRHPAYPLVVVREHVTNHGTVVYGEK